MAGKETFVIEVTDDHKGVDAMIKCPNCGKPVKLRRPEEDLLAAMQVMATEYMSHRNSAPCRKGR